MTALINMPAKMTTSKKSSNTISFFTNCYENDWEILLKEGRLSEMIKLCNLDFFERVLIINNVIDRDKVQGFANEAVKRKIIDAYYFSEDYSDKILSSFSINRRSFILDFYDGYWYSMGPLAAVFFCKSKYLLYFTSDCIMQSNATSYWIDNAINLFGQDQTILIANPVWNNNNSEADKESYYQHEEWYFSRTFSDQCFLVENERLYGNFYNEYNRLSERYPVYAGKLFEMRVDSYMQNNGLSRITNKHVSYFHEDLLKEKRSAQFKIDQKIKRLAGDLSRRIRKSLFS